MYPGGTELYADFQFELSAQTVVRLGKLINFADLACCFSLVKAVVEKCKARMSCLILIELVQCAAVLSFH